MNSIQVFDGFEIHPPKPRLSALDQIHVRRLLLNTKKWADQLIGQKGPNFFDSGTVYAPHIPEAVRGIVMNNS